MRIAFKEEREREIVGLLLRILTINSSLDWPNKTDKEEVEAVFEELPEANKP